MLAREDTTELFGLFKLILDQIKVEQKFVEEDGDEDAENKAPNSQSKKAAFEKNEIKDKSLLKSSMFALIGNLCNDKSLRMKFANDNEGILNEIITDFRIDVAERKFDWLDMATK